MTTNPPIEPLDDDAIGAAVRDVAGQWTMPAVRLDAPGWRARVRSPRTRRLAALRGAIGRAGQAAGAALALAVAAALLGVYMTNLGAGKPGDSHAPTGGPSGRPDTSPEAAASPLPGLFVDGALPGITHLLVSDEATFEVLDLATGTLTPALGGGWYGSSAVARPDGSVTCLCISGDGFSRNGAAAISVTLQAYDRDGASVSSGPVATYRGAPDPRDPITPETPQDVAVAIAPGLAAGTRVVGWTVHVHPVWHSGVDVVDLATATVVSHISLPDRSDGAGTVRLAPVAPKLIGLGGDGRAILSQWWMSWSPPAATNPASHSGADGFTVAVDGAALSDLQPFAAASQCGYDITEAGPRPNGAGTWLTCPSNSGSQTRLRLIDTAGAVTDMQIGAAVAGYGEGSGSLVSPDGRWLYLWDPTHLELTRVDLADGGTTKASATTATATDPLAALGRWLVPATAAKVLLDPGLAISADGARIYALGVPPGSGVSGDRAGSTGVLVFDATSMRQVDRWAPLADFVSIAVSADGSAVFAAGAPETAVDGSHTSQPASITAYDAATGKIRLIAGNLGQGFVTFPSPILP